MALTRPTTNYTKLTSKPKKKAPLSIIVFSIQSLQDKDTQKSQHHEELCLDPRPPRLVVGGLLSSAGSSHHIINDYQYLPLVSAGRQDRSAGIFQQRRL